MSLADALTDLAHVLRVQQLLFEENTFDTMSAELYVNLINILKEGRKTCKTDPTLAKIDPTVRDTIGAIVQVMEELSDKARILVVARGAYANPQGAGSVAATFDALAAARVPHAEMRQRLEELAGDVETAADGVSRHGGATNSSQSTNEERPYRAMVTRMDGEYRRGLRRSG